MLNQIFEQWLERTGNGKTHGTTKKVPAEVFEVERAKEVASRTKVKYDAALDELEKLMVKREEMKKRNL